MIQKTSGNPTEISGDMIDLHSYSYLCQGHQACICPAMVNHWFQTLTKECLNWNKAVVFMGYLLTTFPGVKKVIFIPETDLGGTTCCADFFHDLCFYVSMYQS